MPNAEDPDLDNRKIPASQQPRRGNKFARMTGIGRPRPKTTFTLVEAVARMLTTIIKIPVFLMCISYGKSVY